MRLNPHRTVRRVIGTSVVVIAATVVPAGIAGAADYPNGGNPPAVSPQNGATSPQSGATSPQSGSAVKAATTTSTLPFTGGDVAGLALIGVGAALAGTVLVRRSRRHADA